jgi:hypothetical protein
MHIHAKGRNMQPAATVTWATTKLEKKSKYANGAATGRIRRDISYPLLQRVPGETWLGTQLHRFEGLIGALR